MSCRTLGPTQTAQEFYRECLDKEDFIPTRRKLLRQRAGLRAKDSMVAWHYARYHSMSVFLIMQASHSDMCWVGLGASIQLCWEILQR